MARMMSLKERKARKTMASIARGLLGLMDAKDAVTSPHTYVTKRILENLSKADKVKMRRGPIKNRYQVYNSRIGMWVKIDSKTGKIIEVKKDGLPFKEVPKRRKKRRKNKLKKNKSRRRK